MRGPAFSFRDVPWAIYVGLGCPLFGSVIYLCANIVKAGGDEDSYESYLALARWRLLDDASSTIQIVLLPLGLFELARRHTGAARTLVTVGGSLLFIHLWWITISILTAIADPSSESYETIYTWSGRVVGMTALVAAILITIGADAWRRVTIAAIGLMLLYATSYWVPVLGPAINEALGRDNVVRLMYALLRQGLAATCWLFIAAALAAGGRDLVPDPAHAVRGLLLARGALIGRLIAALVLAFLTVGAKAASIGKVVAFSTPIVAIATMVLFALGLQQVARARLPGMPRILLVIGAALTLWWCSVQSFQLVQLISSVRDRYSNDRALESLSMFAVVGPLVAMVGIVLAAVAVLAYANRNGLHDLGRAVLGRLIAFGILTVVNVIAIGGALVLAEKPDSEGRVIFLLVVAAGLGIAALLMIAQIFGAAAKHVYAPPP